MSHQHNPDPVFLLTESTQRLSDAFKFCNPEIEWYNISGLQNILDGIMATFFQQ